MMTETKIETVPDEMRPNEAARYAGLNRSYLYALLAAEVIPSRYDRGRRLIRRDHLDQFRAWRERQR
jgi:excisionase family DNA binding protein